MTLLLNDKGISPNMIFNTLKSTLSEVFVVYMKAQLTPQCLNFVTLRENTVKHLYLEHALSRTPRLSRSRSPVTTVFPI
jgi:hypothetical protein